MFDYFLIKLANRYAISMLHFGFRFFLHLFTIITLLKKIKLNYIIFVLNLVKCLFFDMILACYIKLMHIDVFLCMLFISSLVMKC